ncbi:MAG TPA: sn-glycerol-1-phosphate dehydrogenase [Symbiobacteriaceae bacterium]|nr:sn-glycerol-1-phosphate dehydrogenase [Symbiobacteriaceae bacterium]
MSSPRVQEALRGASQTWSVLLGTGVLSAVERVFSENFGGLPVMVVADSNTFEIAGRAVMEYFRNAGRQVETPFIFPGAPVLHADYEHVAELRAVLCQTPAIAVAVGSGTINDLTKLASHECGKPYMVVATAASMDGYVAFGAAITKDGFKQTISCAAPRALLADTSILAAAPLAMTGSGYADLLGKVTAGADWLLADAFGVEPIMPAAWSLVQPDLRTCLGQPAALRAGDLAATEALIEGLVLGGLAMQVAESSRPASGCEHQFSHLWEMEGLTPVSHGFKVGIGSLAIAALYEWLLAWDPAGLDIDGLCAAWPTREALTAEIRAAIPNPVLAEKAVEVSLAKHLTPVQLAERLTILKEKWPALREALRAQMMTAGALREWLQAAGCPVTPEGIGLTPAVMRDTFRRARYIRSRYTLLDLIVETGNHVAAMESLFGPGGFYGAH